MSSANLPTTTFDASTAAHSNLRDTVIEDCPQISVRRAAPPQRLPERPKIISPMSDDFPTPRANPNYAPVEYAPESPASSDTQSDHESIWSKASPKSDFDELYDVTDSESEELPLKLAASSCPSTPDIAQQANQDDAWEVPVQLDPSSFNILRSIN
ncbi:hypothetical protein KC352_g42250, partial [Hortaea werneckii]